MCTGCGVRLGVVKSLRWLLKQSRNASGVSELVTLSGNVFQSGIVFTKNELQYCGPVGLLPEYVGTCDYLWLLSWNIPWLGSPLH